MLRCFYNFQHRKKLDVPNICSSSLKEVIVDVRDPLDKKKIVSSHSDFVPDVRELDPASLCHNDEAELYSIRNMLDVGMSPVVAPSSFIKADISTALDADFQCAELLDKMTEKESVAKQSEEPAKSEE